MSDATVEVRSLSNPEQTSVPAIKRQALPVPPV